MVSKNTGEPFGLMSGGKGESRRPLFGCFVIVETILEYVELMYEVSVQYLLFEGI